MLLTGLLVSTLITPRRQDKFQRIHLISIRYCRRIGEDQKKKKKKKKSHVRIWICNGVVAVAAVDALAGVRFLGFADLDALPCHPLRTSPGSLGAPEMITVTT